MDNQEFVDLAISLFDEEVVLTEEERERREKKLIKEWFSKVGATVVENWAVYFYDEELKKIRCLPVTVVACE